MNCLRCSHLKVGGQLRDELYCTGGRCPVRLFFDDLNVGYCGHVRGAEPRRWTTAEKVWLRLNYGRHGPKACAEFLDRTYASVVKYAITLGLRYDTRRRWSHAEDLYMIEHYGDGTAARRRAIGSALKRTVVAVGWRAQKLGLKRDKHPRWTKRDLRYLERNACLLNLPTIARRLGRTLQGVELTMKRYGIRVRQYWSLNDMLRLYRSTHHRALLFAIRDGKLPATLRLDQAGRGLWQINAEAVARFVLASAKDYRATAPCKRLSWLSIDLKELARLSAEADGLAPDLESLAARIESVLMLRYDSPTRRFRTYIAGALRAQGYDAYVPGRRDYLLTDAPLAALDDLFASQVRIRIQAERFNAAMREQA